MYAYQGKVVRVVDGDTIDIEVDLGFSVKIKERFRLAYINAPEYRTRNKKEKARGVASKEYLEKLILQKVVDVYTIKDTKGKYGRYLAEVYIGDKVKSVNDRLVEEGHAEYVKY